MAGNAFDNINGIYLSDTFRAWFDKTNQLIDTLNPLEIYGVTNDQGEYAGITYSIGSNGIVTFGLDLPNSLTGDFTFVNGVTFANFLNVSGLTVDFGSAVLHGNVVRTVNGLTGDVTFSTVATPGSAATGDILVYNTGGTYEGYNLFSNTDPSTMGNNPLHIGHTGGVFFGVTAGGASAADWLRLGEIQLVGSTSSAVYLTNNSLSALTDSQIAGADVRYEQRGGSNVLTVAGRNLAGTRYATENLVIDFDTHSVSVAGAATGSASLLIGDDSTYGKPIVYTDNSGSTFELVYFTAGEAGTGRTSGGYTGLAAFGGNPASKGLQDDERIRLAYQAGSVEIELDGSGATSGFAVYGKEAAYGDLLLPTLVARRDGNVVIGGIGLEDGGATGTTFGGLNIASGKLYVGGTAGAAISTGYQVLSSNGVTCGWRVLNSTATSLDGSIGIPTYATLNTTTGSISLSTNDSSVIRAVDEKDNFILGPFTATIHLPQMMIKDQPTNPPTIPNGVIGVRMTLDAVDTDKYITWEELWSESLGSNKIVSPSFTFTGDVGSKVIFTPFATNQNGYFEYVAGGSYLITFNKLG